MALRRLAYYRRITSAYVLKQRSQLTFWHDVPTMNSAFKPKALGDYYMDFAMKADYPGPYDSAGVPLLNYHGAIGLQYNPIAIAQFGLGNFNLLQTSRSSDRLKRSLAAANWLLSHLEPNTSGLDVWNHHFNWEYRTPLIAPWYSGLAQGQGISLLIRAYLATGNAQYIDAAERAFKVFQAAVRDGGVLTRSGEDVWLEEYVVDPPTHILNGCIWALWGIYDFALLTGRPDAWRLFSSVCDTIAHNLSKYDAGFWSLYEQSDLPLQMLASPFYHALHIVQLRVLHRLTGRGIFNDYAEQWHRYSTGKLRLARAVLLKGLFKLLYY